MTEAERNYYDSHYENDLMMNFTHGMFSEHNFSESTINVHRVFGQLAWKFCKVNLKLEVLKSNAGFYIGTARDGMPCSRESLEYFSTFEQATTALTSGNWTQKEAP